MAPSCSPAPCSGCSSRRYLQGGRGPPGTSPRGCWATPPRWAWPGVLLRSLNGVDPAFTSSARTTRPSPWGLVSSALTLRRLGGRVRPVDAWGFRRWPRSSFDRGREPAVAYLMAPFLLSLFALLTARSSGARTPTRPSGGDDGHRARPLGGLRLACRAPQRLDAVEGRDNPAVRPCHPEVLQSRRAPRDPPACHNGRCMPTSNECAWTRVWTSRV